MLVLKYKNVLKSHFTVPFLPLSPLPLPYKNTQNLLSLLAKNFQIPNLPSFSRETNRNPRTLFHNSLISTAQSKRQENQPEEKPQGSSQPPRQLQPWENKYSGKSRESFSCHGSNCKGAIEHFGRYIKEGESSTILGRSFWTLEAG